MTTLIEQHMEALMIAIRAHLDNYLTLEECMELCHQNFERYRKEKKCQIDAHSQTVFQKTSLPKHL